MGRSARGAEYGRVTDAEINSCIQERYASARLQRDRAAGYWVRCVVDDCEEGAVLQAMAGTVSVWQRREAWSVRVDPQRVAEDALRWLLWEPLDQPLARIRTACWPLIASGMHLSDPAAVERAARNAAPFLPDHWRVAELAAVVSQQRSRATRAARGRR